MRISKYRAEISEEKKPVLVKEQAFNYSREFCLNNADIAVRFLQEKFHAEKLYTEHLWMLTANTKLNLTGIFEISSGSVNGTLAGMKEIFTKALLAGATGIILAHNHPSGDVTASKEDLQVMEKIQKCCELLEIQFLDFIIIGDREYKSYRK